MEDVEYYLKGCVILINLGLEKCETRENYSFKFLGTLRDRSQEKE
jgi:hypothetical protein